MNDKKRTLPIIMIIVVFILIYGLFIRPNYHLVNGGIIYLEAVQVGKLDVSKGSRITTMNDELYIATREGLTKRSLKGESIWNKSYHLKELLFLSEEPYMAVVNITGKEAFIFDKNGSIAHIKTDYIIIGGTLNEVGYLTLILENEQENYISLYNSNGELVVKRRTLFEEDGYPIYVEMSKDATKMMTSHLDIGQYKIESVITFLDFSNIGEEFEDKVVGHERLQDTMAAKLKFLDQKYGIVIGDNLISFYYIDVVPELIKTVYLHTEILDMTYTDDTIIVSYGEAVTPEGEALANKVVVYSKKGSVIGEYSYDTPVTNLSSDDVAYYIIQSSHIIKYHEDKKVWEVDLHKDVEEIYALSNNRYLIVYKYDYEIVKVKDI